MKLLSQVADNLAIAAGKLSAQAIRVAGLGLGTNLPGKVARKLSPSVLNKLAKQSRLGVIAVSGTNGKSTTAGFLASILSKAGYKLVHNRQGANLVTGITATLIDQANWQGKLDADYCLFEIDEASLPIIAAEVEIDSVIVTNLFRDQLDRFGELDTTARLINKGIAINKSKTVLNADDPNVASLAPESPHLYYGIESMAASCANQVGQLAELSYCGKCGNEYAYELIFYGQLGHYTCPKCNNRRPKPDVLADNVNVHPSGSSFSVKHGNISTDIRLNIPGLFNVYNALAAAAIAFQMDIAAETIKEGLNKYSTLFGRSERLVIDGKSIIIQLIKNPAGASQVVASVACDPDAQILIAINDNLADGRDISWLWDAEFEQLSNATENVIVSGQRAEDMAVRMKYAGLPTKQIQVVTPLEAALKQALEATDDDQTLWILPTYTCLLELQKIFKTMGYSLSGT